MGKFKELIDSLNPFSGEKFSNFESLLSSEVTGVEELEFESNEDERKALEFLPIAYRKDVSVEESQDEVDENVFIKLEDTWEGVRKEITSWFNKPTGASFFIREEDGVKVFMIRSERGALTWGYIKN